MTAIKIIHRCVTDPAPASPERPGQATPADQGEAAARTGCPAPRSSEEAMSNDISKVTSQELLALHAGIERELYRRGITRSSNTPTGDLTEFLFCKAFGWEQERNNAANYDAIDKDHNKRYQIKGRRISARNPSRQLGVIRDLQGAQFDYLVLSNIESR